MGKTKTAFIGEVVEEKKTSAEKYAEKKAKREAKVEKDITKVDSETSSELPQEEIKVKEPVAVEKVRGRKYLEAKAKISKSNTYKISDAIKLIKDTSYSKFDGTMEMHLVLKKLGTNVNCTFPYTAGKAKKIEIADEKTLEKLAKNKIDFDLLLATPDMMPKLVAFAKLLGPKGLMPNPKNGTIIKSAKEAEKFAGNTINLKTEKEAPLIHTSFGKVSQKTEELVKNAQTILEKLGGGKTIIRAFIKSTMSPSVKIQI